MTEQEKYELLNRIKDKVANEMFKGTPIKNLSESALNKLWPEVCHRYAEEVNKKLIEAHQLQMRFEQGKWYKGDMEDKISELESEIERLKQSREKSCIASLEKAAENAWINFGNESVVKPSITDKSNIVIIE